MSYTKRIFLSFMAFGVTMGSVFPLFASLFVDIRPGMEVFFTVSCIAAGLMMGVMSFVVYKLVIGNVLKRLSEVFQRVSDGKMDVTCHIESNDDIGKMAKSLNQMIQKLSSLLGTLEGRINELSDSINRTASKLSDDVKASTSVFATVNEAVNEVAASNQLQEEGAEESARTIHEIAEAIQTISSSAGTASELSLSAVTDAESGKKAIESLIEQMHVIDQSVHQSAETSRHLEQRSKEIGEMISSISALASQTNMLALNAGIEAARAGQHGQGFAVVAQEVRKLAEQTESITKQMIIHIHQIQTNSASIGTAMNTTVSEVDSGVVLANTSRNHFHKITEDVKTASNQISQVSASVEQVAAGSEEIAATMEDMTHVAVESKKRSEQVKLHAQQHLDTMKEISILANDLKGISHQLKTSLDSFAL